MKKIFSMLSLAAVMFVAMFAMTPQVAHAFDMAIGVKNIKFEPQKNEMKVDVIIVNAEKRPIEVFDFECHKLTISYGGKEVFSTNGDVFTVEIDSEDAFIIPPGSSRLWTFTLTKEDSPNMTKIPSGTFNTENGWMPTWSFKNIDAAFADETDNDADGDDDAGGDDDADSDED